MSTSNLSDLPESSLADVEQRGTKRLNDSELDTDNKKCRTVVVDGDDEADAIEEKLDCNMSTLNDQSEIKEGLCNRGADSLPSECLDEKFFCTICDKVALEVHQHPLLKVIICGDCNCLMEEKKHAMVWT